MNVLPFHHQTNALQRLNEIHAGMQAGIAPPTGYQVHEWRSKLLIVMRGDTQHPVLIAAHLRNPTYATIAAESFRELLPSFRARDPRLPFDLNQQMSTKAALEALLELEHSGPRFECVEPLVPLRQVLNAKISVLHLVEALQ